MNEKEEKEGIRKDELWGEKEISLTAKIFRRSREGCKEFEHEGEGEEERKEKGENVGVLFFEEQFDRMKKHEKYRDNGLGEKCEEGENKLLPWFSVG